MLARAGDYVDETYLSIRWDGVHKHVFSEWKAFANSAELRAGLLKGIQAIRDHGAYAYVSDARKFKVIVHADQGWIRDSWLPLGFAAGLRRFAFVTAPAGLGKLTIEDVSGLVGENGLQSRTFDSIAAARRWISEPRVQAVTARRPQAAVGTTVVIRSSTPLERGFYRGALR
ncbi:MAG TPA: hypothetical protein VNF26_00935 [Candidatus Baltobacterales bacterium]|nr:hypothetical protein [Candidatus Baltobacterales bacterium]